MLVIQNRRPVLIDGILEASYPSSTTMLMLCVMPTAMMQFCERIKKIKLRYFINSVIGIYTFLMVVGRMVSGVHWLSDIFGGMLISTALVLLYYSANNLIAIKSNKIK